MYFGKRKKEMKRFLAMMKETSTNSSPSLSHRKQLQSLDMMKKQLRESKGERTDRRRGSSGCQGEEEKGTSMRECLSVVLSLGLGAVHAACTVVRADAEKPTVFPTQGLGRGKLANCKYRSEWENPTRARGPAAERISTSPTDPFATQIKNRLKATQFKAKDPNRV